MEAWAPAWNVCESEDRAPDFYFQVFDVEAHLVKKPRFNPIILCAAGASMGKRYLGHCGQAARELAKLVDSRLFARKRRTWGIGSEFDDFFEDSLMDLPVEGTLFRGNPHARPTDFRILAEKWDRVCGVRQARRASLSDRPTAT